MFQILQGGLSELQALVLAALVVICILAIVVVFHKTRAFVPVLITVVLCGLVLFAANNAPFLQKQACQAVADAARTGGTSGPTC